MNSDSVESSDNEFSTCYLQDEGGVFYFTGLSFTDTGSTFSKMVAKQGSIMYCKNCASVTFNASTISQIYGFQGAAIYLETDTDTATTFNFFNVSVTDVAAI